MSNRRYHRRVIEITGMDSPNVSRALRQIELGLKPDGKVILPGVLTWEEYCYRRETWPAERQMVGLDAQFYNGPELRMFPTDWLDLCLAFYGVRPHRYGKTYMGVDPAEGGDRTAFCVGDELGVLYIDSLLTRDTKITRDRIIELVRLYNIDPQNVVIDRACGHTMADWCKSAGYPIRTVAFSEQVTTPLKRSKVLFEEKKEAKEDASLYASRRIEMYWEMSYMLNPQTQTSQFSLPPSVRTTDHVDRLSLYDQLKKIPKERDDRGRPWLRPKQRKVGEDEKKVKTLIELIGHSPDEADALVLYGHARRNKPQRATAGVR